MVPGNTTPKNNLSIGFYVFLLGFDYHSCTVWGLGLGCLTPLSTIFQLYRQVKETGVSGENHWPAASYWQALSHNPVSSTSRLSGIRIHVSLRIITFLHRTTNVQASNWTKWTTRIQLNSGAPETLAAPVPIVAPVVLLLLQIRWEFTKGQRMTRLWLRKPENRWCDTNISNLDIAMASLKK